MIHFELGSKGVVGDETVHHLGPLGLHWVFLAELVLGDVLVVQVANLPHRLLNEANIKIYAAHSGYIYLCIYLCINLCINPSHGYHQNTIIILRRITMQRQTWAALTLLLTLVGACTDQSSCFIKKLFDFSFPEEGVYSIALNEEANSLHNNILGYGDFNNDLKADYVAIDPQTKDILFFYYSNQGDLNGQYFQQSKSEALQGCHALNAYLYDVNRDGKLDVTIWGQYANQSKCLYPLIQGKHGSFTSSLDTPQLFASANTTQPILLQTSTIIPGAITSCLLVYDSVVSVRKILYYINNGYDVVNWKGLFPIGQNVAVPFSNQHWNSFIDITNDCKPDIVITNDKRGVEFWVSSSNGFVLAQTVELRSLGISLLTSLTFVDVNYDGEQDIVMSSQTEILVFMSTQKATTQFCISGKTTFTFDWNNPVKVPLPNQNCSLQKQNIHFGDLNIDAYPDLLFICSNDHSLWVYENGFDQPEGSFKPFDAYQEAFTSYLVNSGFNVSQVSLFDVLQNGIIDIMVTVHSNQTVVLYNNYLYQNFFYIKGLATDGKSTDSGTQIAGASFYWLNSLGNSQKISIYSQMFQTAYGAVPMPYVLAGLGKANNYVEQFTIGRLGNSKSWSPIIPNSQLAVFSGQSKVSSWGIKIFILPTDSIVYVLIVCIVILTTLGSALVVLKCKSKREENVLLQDYM